MITHLKNDITEFEAAIHIADIHIRLTKRHDEYIEVLNELYDLVDKSPKETFVTVVGDIFHSKSDLSPECVQIASEFLRTLANKRPTILVAGNHDTTLSNKDRLDSLSPIVESLNHPNLYYLKDSGLYILGDILFNNMSVFDDYEKYIKASDIPTLYRNQTRHLISLYHGTIDKANTDMGHLISNRMINTDTFDGHDISMCGDIHRAQTLYIEKELPHQSFVDEYINTGDWEVIEGNRIRKKFPIIRYCGSICQQDHGEDIGGHGCTIWNLKARKYVHIDLDNNYGFFTIQINKGKLVTDITNIPKKVRLRVMCLESVATEVKAVLTDIKRVSEIIESVYIRLSNEDQLQSSIIQSTALNLSDLSSVDYQNKLIEIFIKKKFVGITITQAQIDKIFDINRELNGKIDKDNLVRNIRWKPKKFEFSNMFSYGEDNVIDFTKMKDVMGLFAPNSSGKSTVLDALSFCLYDKCSRAYKASHILNSQKMSFKCKFNFEISGVDYFIERKGTSDKKGNVKVDVKFWKEVDGKPMDLNGTERYGTNDIIRDFVGSYDDFILTVLSIQNGKSGTFIDMGQTERKDLLSQFMGLNLFDMLYTSATKRLGEIETLLNNYDLSSDKTQAELVSEFVENIKVLTDRITNKTTELDLLQHNRTTMNSDIIAKNKELIPLEEDVPKNVVALEEEKKSIIEKIDDIKYTIEESKKVSGSNASHLSQIVNDITELIDKNVVQLYKDYQLLCEKFDEEEIVLDKNRIVIQSKLDKIHKLESHKYDPNCKFCVDNEFVKDAMTAQESLSGDKVSVGILLNTHSDTKTKRDALSYTDGLHTKLLLLEKAKISKDKEISNNTTGILRLENSLEKNNNVLKGLTEKIELYYAQKEAVEHNNGIELEIKSLTAQLKTLDSTIKTKSSELMQVNSNLINTNSSKDKLETDIAAINALESEQKAYEYYISSISRDGIPFELISQAIPIIEQEVNDILHQVVEFGINIQTDGKNVMTYIVRNNRKWPLELAGGLEKFLSGLALRVALINISNLPRPNFIAIDEGFGCADAENLPCMASLFSILKVHFDFIWIISHLDSMKDMVNTRVEIVKEGEFSKINFV